MSLEQIRERLASTALGADVHNVRLSPYDLNYGFARAGDSGGLRTADSRALLTLLQEYYYSRRLQDYRVAVRYTSLLVFLGHVCMFGYDYVEFVSPTECSTNNAMRNAMLVRGFFWLPSMLALFALTYHPIYDDYDSALKFFVAAMLWFLVGLVLYPLISQDPGYGVPVVWIALLYTFLPLPFKVLNVLVALVCVSYTVLFFWIARNDAFYHDALENTGMLVFFACFQAWHRYRNEYFVRTTLLKELAEDRHRRRVADAAAISETVLLSVLPVEVIRAFTRGMRQYAEHINGVTVLFCKVCHYSELTAQLPPAVVVSVLNCLYTHFDHLLDDIGVYKVETVGEVYMVVSGAPRRFRNHAELAAEMALRMHEAMPEIRHDVLHLLRRIAVPRDQLLEPTRSPSARLPAPLAASEHSEAGAARPAIATIGAAGGCQGTRSPAKRGRAGQPATDSGSSSGAAPRMPRHLRTRSHDFSPRSVSTSNASTSSSHSGSFHSSCRSSAHGSAELSLEAEQAVAKHREFIEALVLSEDELSALAESLTIADTVNTASRMESTCEPGKTQCSPQCAELLKSEFHVPERGEIEVKGKGRIVTYYLESRSAKCEGKVREVQSVALEDDSELIRRFSSRGSENGATSSITDALAGEAARDNGRHPTRSPQAAETREQESVPIKTRNPNAAAAAGVRLTQNEEIGSSAANVDPVVLKEILTTGTARALFDEVDYLKLRKRVLYLNAFYGRPNAPCVQSPHVWRAYVARNCCCPPSCDVVDTNNASSSTGNLPGSTPLTSLKSLEPPHHHSSSPKLRRLGSKLNGFAKTAGSLEFSDAATNLGSDAPTQNPNRIGASCSATSNRFLAELESGFAAAGNSFDMHKTRMAGRRSERSGSCWSRAQDMCLGERYSDKFFLNLLELEQSYRTAQLPTWTMNVQLICIVFLLISAPLAGRDYWYENTYRTSCDWSCEEAGDAFSCMGTPARQKYNYFIQTCIVRFGFQYPVVLGLLLASRHPRFKEHRVHVAATSIAALMLSAGFVYHSLMGVDRGFLIVAVCFATMLNVSIIVFYLRVVMLSVLFLGYLVLRLSLPVRFDCTRYTTSQGNTLCSLECGANVSSLVFSNECTILSHSDVRVFGYLLVIVLLELVPAFMVEYSQRVYFYKERIVMRQKQLANRQELKANEFLSNLLPPSVVQRLKSMRLQENLSKSAIPRLDLFQQGSDGTMLQHSARARRQLLDAPSAVIADRFDEVTVLFTDLQDFTSWSASHSALDLVSFINVMVTEFDKITEHHGCHKVEVIGDAYYAVGGCPVQCADHAARVVACALDLVEQLGSIRTRMGIPPSQLQMRCGLHTGPVVAGVVGLKDPRYHLFGDTVNLAEEMESCGVPGKVHITEQTRRSLLQSGFGDRYELELRGTTDVKTHGAMRTWFVRHR